MAGFKLNSDGDIEVDSNGKMLLLATKQELVKQRLQIKLKTFKGEWWLDTSFGIPYRDTGDGKAIIGKGFTQRDIDALYIAAINEDPDVEGIEYFRSEYDPTTRTYATSFEVRAPDELLNSYQVGLQSWEEETYNFNSTVLSSSCDINFTDWTLSIHPIVHEDIPLALRPPYSWNPALGMYIYEGYVYNGFVGY